LIIRYYLIMKTNKGKKKQKKQRTYDTVQICTICGQPMRKKGLLCGSCSRIRGEAKRIIKSKYKVLTQNSLIYIMKNIVNSYEPKIVLAWISEHPYDYWTFLPRKSRNERKSERRELKKNAMEKQKSDVQLDKKKLTIDSFPYLQKEFSKRKNLKFELISVRGIYRDPKIFVRCRMCESDFVCGFEEFKNSKFNHHCMSSVSSGELIIHRFLESRNINFVVQRQTLFCQNPITKRQLPYDFELTDYKILIEVQGNQHLEFTSYFQQTEKNFKYQCWKDTLKKNFAENKGYILLAITYPQIDSRVYQTIIHNAILERLPH